MAYHELTITAWDFQALLDGDKHFLVLPATTPPMVAGDRLHLSHPAWPTIRLVGTVRYRENGLSYLPDSVGIEIGDITKIYVPAPPSAGG